MSDTQPFPEDKPEPSDPPASKRTLTTAALADAQPAANVRGEPRRFDDREAESLSAAPSRPDQQAAAPLFSEVESGERRRKWGDLQTSFVDEPRRAVEQADGLVAETMQRLAQIFAEERSRLEGQWDRGDDVSTEDLRLALRRYRAFFSRLLSV